ncbi:MAG: NADPH-dependent FMN reductase [Bdellovibrionales bacterium]|jgi:NAD(P)H-dependent FMN reductase|nr:NADPH-dependent FMN reductase [Bdellovibrionales bacterium]
MKHIIVGTDRVGSNSLKIAEIIQGLYKTQGEDVAIVELGPIMKGLAEGAQYGNVTNPILKKATDELEMSDGLIFVVPEYNGSMPGALKYFIDHLRYPEAFEARPVCFVGLGGMFGGLRPVEHLQQVFGYRNAYMFPERVFIQFVWNHFKKTDANPNGVFQDPLLLSLLERQSRDFSKFVSALKSAGLHALVRPKA